MSMIETLEIDTVAKSPAYDISGYNIVFDLIKSLTVDNVPYNYKNLNDNIEEHIYYKPIDNNTQKVIGSYPTPDKNELKIRILFEKQPKKLTADNLNIVSELRKNY